MVQFVIGQSITTDTPSVSVDGGLAVGRHRFRLQVVDSAGNLSRPDEVVVTIQRLVITPITPITPVTPVRPGPIRPVIDVTPVIPRN